MKKIGLILSILLMGGCASQTPPSEWEDEPVQEEQEYSEEEEVVEEPQEENAPYTLTDDELVNQQNEAEYSIYVHDRIQEEAITKTKPISYERSVIRDQNLKNEFMRTWQVLDETPNIPLSDSRLGFVKKEYEVLLEHSKTCCTSGISAELERKSVEKDKTYEFLKNDYNFYRAGELCYFYSDTDLEQIFGRSDDIREMIKRVQKSCLCLNHDRLKEKTSILRALLTHQNINKRSLIYTAYDEFGRRTRRHMKGDVFNLDKKLRCCTGNPQDQK